VRLKLTLVSGAERDDIIVGIDASVSVGALAERLRVSHPRVRPSTTPGPTLCIRVHPGTPEERTVPALTALGESGIRSGDVVTLTNAAEGTAVRATAATLRVTAGPDAGRSFPVPSGTTVIGRDRNCEVRLSDALISKRHARLNITDMVEVIDDNSANGVQVGQEFIQRAVVSTNDVVRMGDTEFSVTLHKAASQSVVGQAIEFNRSPRLDPAYKGIELIAPEPPQRPQPQRFPMITMVAPLLMGAVMYLVTRNALSLMFMALSPVMMVGSFFENKWSTKKALEAGTTQFRASLKDLAVQLQYAADLERKRRRGEHPSVDEVSSAIDRLTPLTWTRRPEHVSFAHARLGLGTQSSRNSVKLPTTNNTTPELWRELHDVAGQFTTIDRVPVVVDLRLAGSIGIAGPALHAHPLASGTVAQFVGLHSPAELVLAAIVSTSSSKKWEWLKWLPHSGSEFSPLICEHLVTNGDGDNALISALEDLLAQRSVEKGGTADAPKLPLVLLVVEDDGATDRGRLVQLAERGPACGVHLIWCSASLERVPAACRAYLEVNPNTGAGLAGFVADGTDVSNLEVEPLAADAVSALARRLAPVTDAGAVLQDQSDLPRSVSFLTLGGPELADSTEEMIARWRASNSLPPEMGGERSKRPNNLRALVGQAGSGAFYLDLREQGPHALVGGTTGAGKSEFLQSWILGMAAAHSPTRVNFLFVDYKGGAAFADCVALPHCVGLVTDLSQHLVRRALRSLNAELRRREHILNRKKAKDLLELERRGDPECPPSLVIVVDEFAALVSEVPEFVDGVVNVAQRGRSLGLHLILATQRPAGVIKDNLRANTNLRVALRMADEEDSSDVIGTPQAGTLDPSIPGRGFAKTGPGRLTGFQSAYVGGQTSGIAPPPIIDVNSFRFGIGTPWDAPPVLAPASDDRAPELPTDIRRVVENIVVASKNAKLPESRKPWLPELSNIYRLEDLPTKRTDAELVFGVIDMPDDQEQPTVAFVPDRDGNMAIYGTGGSGKSNFLRSLAVAAGLAPARGGPCHVYALDFGARGLAMLERLPHVGAVINGDDTERTARLITMLRVTIDERAERYAASNAATIQEYRERSGNHAEARLLVLIDNFGAFRQAYEIGWQGKLFETLEGIAADGRGVGVHIVATADQSTAFTAGMNSVIQSQVALRLTSDMDFTSLGVPTDVFSETTPPGRGFMNGSRRYSQVERGYGTGRGASRTANSETPGADPSFSTGMPTWGRADPRRVGRNPRTPPVRAIRSVHRVRPCAERQDHNGSYNAHEPAPDRAQHKDSALRTQAISTP
jgi:DNA segregation ATPase FtsK/SpoIIIE, S-DNA-T family